MSLHDDGDSPLPYASIAARLRGQLGEDVDPKVELVDSVAAERGPLTPAGRPSSLRVLDRIGSQRPTATRYQVRGEIARGGMGAILEAFDEDLRRKLAMKVMLHAGGSSTSDATRKAEPAKLARFLEEAQITGQLDHPGVVPVHELGLDANGQAYFTMRLVRGRDLEAIFALVDKQKDGWTVTRAVGLLNRVCEAMAYAHTKGVVHRDLKPANVMVGQFGEVYVMDWGLARVLGQPDRHDLRLRVEGATKLDLVETDRRAASSTKDSDNLYTMDGDIMGTPSYMSPEQARGRLEFIREPSDVYSLGAMLYRLLAGVEPYGSREHKVGALAVLERLRAGPPTPLAELAPAAPAELVAICEKAMARDPGERYANMLALAEDLRAYLEGRVVGAFEAGAWAQARKWVRRNRALAATMAAAVLTLVAGLATSITLGRRAQSNAELAEEQRAAAVKNEAEALRQARIAQAANAFLNVDLLESLAPDREGRNVTVRQVLDAASANLAERFPNEPTTEAALQLTMGRSYFSLGEYEAAAPHLERALELGREHEARGSDATFDAMLVLAGVRSELGDTEAALELYDEVLETAREAHGVEHPAAITALNDRGLMLRSSGRADEARAALEQALELDRRVLGPDHRDTLAAENNLALVDQDAGELEEAVTRLRHVLERRTATLGPRSTGVIESKMNLALALSLQGKLDEAEALALEGIELATDLLGPEHSRSAGAEQTLGNILYLRGRLPEALERIERGWRGLAAVHGHEHPRALLARGNYATTLLELRRIDEALEHSTAVLEAQRRVLGDLHTDTLASMNRMASIHRSRNELDPAEAMFRELWDASRDVRGVDHPDTLIVCENLAGVLYSKRQYEESEALVRDVLEARKRVLGAEHPFVGKTTFNLGMVVNGSGNRERALALFEEALDHQRANGEYASPLTLECLRQLGDAQFALRRHDGAIDAYREGLELSDKLGQRGELSAYLEHQLGSALVAMGKLEEGLEQLRSALAAREALLGPDDTQSRVSLFGVGNALFHLQRFEESERALLELNERVLRSVGAQHDHARRCRALLVELYTAWGRPEDAEKWR